MRIYIYTGELANATLITNESKGKVYKFDGELYELMNEFEMPDGAVISLDNCHTHSANFNTKEEIESWPKEEEA